MHRAIAEVEVAVIGSINGVRVVIAVGMEKEGTTYSSYRPFNIHSSHTTGLVVNTHSGAQTIHITYLKNKENDGRSIKRTIHDTNHHSLKTRRRCREKEAHKKSSLIHQHIDILTTRVA